ncbi:MAG: hypothetical protein NWE79_01510 [Candidatus Bathyarchaeota archaeon]|nr:hypothetical protein [Candidatus Bathyarchaeota archaeon]
MSAVSMTALSLQGSLFSEGSGNSGQIISLASAMEAQTLVKEVGQSVHFKATVENNGNVETAFLIVAKWREDGTEGWESGGLTDVRLNPWESETLVVGYVECTETMMGKHFDVKFILYDHETETILDEKEIDRAWYVKETVVDGTITGFWIE